MIKLPDPFLFLDGTQVKNRSDWNKRREELKTLIQRYEYGQLPELPNYVKASLNGSILSITVAANGKESSFEAEITLPTAAEAPYPVVINTGGLDTDTFLADGYALAAFKPNDVALDNKACRAGSFFDLYPGTDTGALMAWAWGFHRVIDALSEVPEINRQQIVITGHSRFGKAALVAGAFDERISVTIPASSGLSGTGNFRLFYEELGANEKIENIFDYAPHWFTPVLGEFVGQADRLPFDQHEVMALIAPRALLVTGGTEDYWSNPQGTGISYQAAKIVYHFLGVQDRIGVAYRSGGHGMTPSDFQSMVDFADEQLQRRKVKHGFDTVPYPDEPALTEWTSRILNSDYP